MRLILKSATFINFRTVKKDVLAIDDDITILVGPNEGGKTNLLEAIELLDFEKEMEISDVKINSDYARRKHLPDIIFEFKIPEELCQKLSKYAKYFKKHDKIFLTRQGNEDDDINIKPPDNLSFNFIDAYKNISEVEQRVYIKNTKNRLITLGPGNYTVSPVIYQKNLKLIHDKKIQKYSPKERDELLYSKIKEIISENLPKVFLWKYSDKYYIPKDIPINFYQDKEKYKSVIDLFHLGGTEEEKISSHLTNRDSVYIHNFLKDLSRRVTRIINNTWRQRNIKLNLHYKGEWIEILVEEKRYEIDPQKRSEGLKWYLSFLINFRSKLQILKNNIILFDQPGDKLHPGGQKDLMERIEELSKENQIIYSTHTPFMINKEYPERVRLITRPDDDTVIINELSNKAILRDELLRNSLGFVLSDIAPIAEKNILVEGLFDKAIFLEFIKKLKKFKFTINLNQSIFLPTHGASKILYYANFLKNNGLSVVAVFDNDIEGRNAITLNKKKKVLANREILTVAVKSGAETIEDLLPINIVQDSVNEVGKQYKNGFQAIKLSIPMMLKIKQHFSKEGIGFNDDIKFNISEKVINKFNRLTITQVDLKDDLKGLYDLIKAIKKKI